MADTDPPIAVFAYGSNLCVERMAARVDKVRTISVGQVRGYVLRFNKKSRDGSAKANAHRTDHERDCVWGAVYALSVDDKRKLDGFEGLGRDYFESEVDVRTIDGRVIRAWLYWANPAYTHEGIAPYAWYKRFCFEGARHHGFPDAYIEAIARVESIADPDSARNDRETEVFTRTKR
jgi:hypothetical protein